VSGRTDELREFLDERRYAVLATHDPDGGIHLTPIWFLFADERFPFASSSKSLKVTNAATMSSAVAFGLNIRRARHRSLHPLRA
jgi:nitroimidazol reductase NimA-like FMN-containing flavoprotein (pyridoxamine 5'-phosphate oxidase superfamily)